MEIDHTHICWSYYHCGAVTNNVNVNILMLVVEWVHKLTTINLSKFSSKPKFVLDVSDDTK